MSSKGHWLASFMQNSCDLLMSHETSAPLETPEQADHQFHRISLKDRKTKEKQEKGKNAIAPSMSNPNRPNAVACRIFMLSRLYTRKKESLALSGSDTKIAQYKRESITSPCASWLSSPQPSSSWHDGGDLLHRRIADFLLDLNGIGVVFDVYYILGLLLRIAIGVRRFAI
ncbi:hypothetical protein KC363_g188 [Hortaea werneckii]|nr:hypothetical protein KC363_g188 [Hortaea werneckii]